jgi:YidC/Oxa1 family membrane protein insertase
MDKRSILAFVIIAILVTVWLIYMSVNQKPPQRPIKGEAAETEQTDTTLKKDTKPKVTKAETEKLMKMADSLQGSSDSTLAIEKFGPELAPFASGHQDIIHIETDLIKAKINTKGGTILEWELKNYKHWAGYPTQLINNNLGEFFIAFETKTRKKIDTRDLFFHFDNLDKLHYTISGNDSLTLTGRITIAPGKEIVKRFVFYGNSYMLGSEITMNNMESIILKNYYTIWEDGLRFQENNAVDEANEAQAIISKKGEIEDIAASGDKHDTLAPKTEIDYASIKSKYFALAVMPQSPTPYDGEVGLSGFKFEIPNHGINKIFRITIKKGYTGGNQTQSFKLFLGPLDYDIVKQYGLENIINFGWRLIVRPIGEYFMLPIFKMIHLFVPNFGISIIIFSIIIKFLLYPLSISQMRSSQKMKLIQPEVNAMREKYKDDNKKQQVEMMNLYREYGINPAGGCLPLILQLPILYALWAVLRTAIDLRQAHFFLWINDLSMPDVIFSLPFRLPLLNVDQFSGLALLMGITMFLQQKLTITDPRQKAMVYMMPVMFTLMFSSFPSGLNLYYFMFNLLSIVQQVYINKFSASSKLTTEDLRKSPKKEGWFSKKMKEAQDIAASQGRSVPGASYDNTSKSKYQRKKKK